MQKRSELSWAEAFAVWFLIACGGVWLFREPLRSPENILHFSDVVHVWFFIKTFMVESVRQFGELPLWNPLIFCGVPFVGNPQAAPFYPLFWLFLAVPVHYAITLLFMFHSILGGCGMYLYARHRRIPVWASLFSCIVFMLNGRLMGHVFAGHLTILCAWAYMPWIFFAVDFFAFSRSVSSLFILAAMGALCFLGGLPQIVYYIAGASFVYLIYITVRKDPAGIISCLIRCILCAVVVAVFVAVALLPIAEMMRFFQRSGGTDFQFASSFSLQFKDLITLVLPTFFTVPQHGSNIANGFFWERNVYCGVLPLFLILVSYRKRQKIYWQFFAVLCAVTFLFAMGSSLPFFRIFYLIIPGVRFFRCPARIFLLTSFSVAVLSGYALQNIAEDRFHSGIRPVYRILLLCAGLLIIVSEALYYTAHLIIPGARSAILLMLISGTLLFLWHKGYVKKAVFICALLLLILFDLVPRAVPLVKSIPLTDIMPSSHIYNGFVSDESLFRIYDTVGAFPQYLGALFNVQQIGGDEPVMLSGYLQYNQRMIRMTDADNNSEPLTLSSFPVASLSRGIDWPMLHFLNVKYIITNHKLKEPFLIKEDEQALSDSSTDFYYGSYDATRNVGGILQPKTYVYRNTAVLPRAFLIPYVPDAEMPIDAQVDWYINDTHRILLPAQVESYSPNEIVFVTESEDAASMVTSEIMYPGWEAYIDGARCSFVAVYDLFRAVYVPKGKHTVLFVYNPRSYRVGRAITLIGAAI
ncbi:hypothetical protein KDK77_03110 [bacterium]|nr:hypothetical protein [bacterium]